MAHKVSEEEFNEVVGNSKKAVEKTKKRKAPADSGTSVIRGIPKVVVQAMRAEFPNATTNLEALDAYIGVFCPEIGESPAFRDALTEREKDLISEHASGVYEQMGNHINGLEKKTDNQNRLLYEILTEVALLNYNYYNPSADPLTEDKLRRRPLGEQNSFREYFDFLIRQSDEFKKSIDYDHGLPEHYFRRRRDEGRQKTEDENRYQNNDE